jgi:hypothetical protein
LIPENPIPHRAAAHYHSGRSSGGAKVSIGYPSFSALQSDLAAERRATRRTLIAEFRERQSALREYVALEDVAKFIARESGGTNLEAAYGDLLGHACVGAFDADKPPLLLLRDDVGVDLQWIQADRAPSEFEGLPPPAAQLWGASRNPHSPSLDEQRSMHGNATMIAGVLPYCWARRETVVALLKKRGATMPEIALEWAAAPKGGNAAFFDQASDPKDRRFLEWVARHEGQENPKREDDLIFMKQEFPETVAADIAKLRAKWKPCWSQKGRPPKKRC